MNTPGSQAGIYSGTGTNANDANTFGFDGNKVRILENQFIGYTKRDGTTVGDDNYWFLCNSEAASMASAMRFVTLYDAEVDIYRNDSNKKEYVSLDMGYAVDHYGLESYIVGSKGTVAVG